MYDSTGGSAMFVNHFSRELCGRIVVVGPAADRTRALFESALQLYGTEATVSLGGRSLDFVPKGLGPIGDFSLRLFVEECIGEPSALHLAADAYVVVLEASSDTARDAQRISELIGEPWGAATRVLVLGQGLPVDATALPQHDHVVLASTEGRKHVSTAIKVCLRQMLLALKKGPAEPSRDELVLVAVPPLLDVLLLLQQRKGRALDDEEIIAARDGAAYVALPRDTAEDLRTVRGMNDIDPAAVVEQWRAFTAMGSG
jgi:hypothetical protein